MKEYNLVNEEINKILNENSIKNFDNIDNFTNFNVESVEQVFDNNCDFEKKIYVFNNSFVPTIYEKIINNIEDLKNINYEKINSLIIGTKSQKIFSLNFEKYFCNYVDLLDIDIKEHFFCKIKLLNWSVVKTAITRNGDLVTNIYSHLQLPSISINIEKVKLSDRVKKIIVYSEIINIFNHLDELSKLEELHFAYEYFNNQLVNLPSGLKILSICSRIFSQSVDYLPSELEYLYINSNSFHSSLDLLPPKLKVLSVGCNNFTNQLDNLPSQLEILHIYIRSHLFCSFDYLPESITCLYISCSKMDSNLQNLPVGLKILFVETFTCKNINLEKFNCLPKNIKQKYIF